jgi:hypothetical protein
MIGGPDPHRAGDCSVAFHLFLARFFCFTERDRYRSPPVPENSRLDTILLRWSYARVRNKRKFGRP